VSQIWGRARTGRTLPLLTLLAALATACAGAGSPASLTERSDSAGTGAAEQTAPLSPLLADPARDRTALAAVPDNLPPVDDDPQQFVGLEALDVAQRLGAPALVRRDGRAEVWLYAGQGCAVDIFLYASDQEGQEGEREAGGLTARYVDLRSPTNSPGNSSANSVAEDRACLAAMLRGEMLRRRGS